MQGNDGITATFASAGDAANASVGSGSYFITATLNDPSSKLGNYALQESDATLTINRAAATIAVTPYSVTYDGKAHTAAGTATGAFGEDLSADLALSGTTHANAGSTTDTWTFTDATGNYNNASDTVLDSIGQGTAEAQTALYGLSQADYHGITTGSNGYSAGPGYNLVSGLGSPLAEVLVPDLVAYSGGPGSTTPVAPIAASGLVLSVNSGSAGGSVAAALPVFSALTAPGRPTASDPSFPVGVSRPAPFEAGRVVSTPDRVEFRLGVPAAAWSNPNVAVSALAEFSLSSARNAPAAGALGAGNPPVLPAFADVWVSGAAPAPTAAGVEPDALSTSSVDDYFLRAGSGAADLTDDPAAMDNPPAGDGWLSRE